MKAKKPTYTWKVVFMTAATPLPEKKFRSERAAYTAINRERELIAEGASRVLNAAVYEWDVDGGRWMTFERHNLAKEAGELRRAEEAKKELTARLEAGIKQAQAGTTKNLGDFSAFADEDLPQEPDDWAEGEDGKIIDKRGEA